MLPATRQGLSDTFFDSAVSWSFSGIFTSGLCQAMQAEKDLYLSLARDLA